MNFLQKLRVKLITNKNIALAYEVGRFLEKPTELMYEKLCSSIDLGENTINLIDELKRCLLLYESNRQQYNEEIIFAQKVIWDEVISCADYVIKTTDIAKSFSAIMYRDNYKKAVEHVHSCCSIISELQARLSKLEDMLGIDRYLDTICEDDIKVIVQFLDEAISCLEVVARDYKTIFQEKWNLTNIKEIILHKLVRYNGDNQICSLMSPNQKKVLVFIVDGFGFCQYLWNKKINEGNRYLTFQENIFAWLMKEQVAKEFVLGSAYISDTAAGLGEIFSGCSTKDTGIVSSKLANNGGLFETKRMSSDTFNRYFNTSQNSTTQIMNSLGYEVEVLYCSKYQDNVSGFSSYIFNGANVKSIVPYERVFSLVKAQLEEREGLPLQFIYLTGIDNTGHTMGAFSKFEKYEHLKFNNLFKNFLVELAMDLPQLFDGQTSILITADHGMAESARLMINRHEMVSYLNQNGIDNPIIIEDNRALLIYGIENEEQSASKHLLHRFFESQNVAVDIITKQDPQFFQHFSTSGTNDERINIMPDIVVRIISNGLFYSNARINKHLMHYGGHGGFSISESLVPLIELVLSDDLLQKMKIRFLNRI